MREKKRRLYRVFACILAVLMLVMSVPIGQLVGINLSCYIKANASDSMITTDMIKTVCDKYGYKNGSYWTTYETSSGKASGSVGPGYFSNRNNCCSKIKLTVKDDLYATNNPVVNGDYWKSYNYMNQWECHGFACYVMAKVIKNATGKSNDVMPTLNGNKNGWKMIKAPDVSDLKVGDIVRVTGGNIHSAIVYSISKSGKITFLEAGGGSHCLIRIGEGFDFSTKYSTLESIKKSPKWTFSYVYRFTDSSAIKSDTAQINKSNSKISVKDFKIPLQVNKGKNFNFSGKISSSEGLTIAGAYIINCNTNKSEQFSFESPILYAGPKFPQTFGAMTATKITQKLDLSRLSIGKYRLYIFASTKVCVAQNIEQLKKSDDYLIVYNGTFEVKENIKKALKSKAASTVTQLTDSNGNKYSLLNGVFINNGTSTTYNKISSTGSSSEYNSKASYTIGNYKVKAKAGLNTRKFPSATSTKISTLKYGTTIAVTATDGNWGYTSKGWICLDYATRVSALHTETYNTVNYDTGKYRVTAHDGLKIRTGAGTNYSQLGGLKYDAEFVVTKVDGSWGYSKDLKGWLCLNYASYVKEPDVPPLPVPDTPSVSSVTSSEVAVGDLISVNWKSVADADCYTASLIDTSSKKVLETKERITNTETTFATPYAGTFDISVVAINSQQMSAAGYINGISAKSPSIVTFKDWNGMVISTQEVAYGRDATVPQSPSRTGYSFKQWSKSATCIRQNTEITAEYTKNSYTVNFCDYNGSIIDSQTVFFEDSAKAPSYSAPTGYSFVAWDKDFSTITDNMDVTAIIQWTSSYPLEISTTSNIFRNGKTYITTAIVNNSPNSVTNAKVIVSLKTSENKELAEVSSNIISLAAGEVKNVTLAVDYDKGAATVGDIFVVNADSNNIPLANKLTVKVDQGTAWSQWDSNQPPVSSLETQSRTEYSKRTKSYTTSSNASLGDGWVRYNTTSAYSDWSGWSSWQDSYVGSSDLCEVKTQTVQDTNSYTVWGDWSGWQDSYVGSSALVDVRTQSVPASYKTVYHYYYYTKTNSEKDGLTSYYKSSSYPYGPWKVSFDSSLPTTTGGTSVPVTKYKWSNHHGTGKYMYVYADDPYTTQEVTSYKTQYSYRTRSYGTKTQYSYRTRSLNYTYYYYKWTDWSSWTTEPVVANGETEVQTRTTYRYISNIPENVEDKSGIQRTITGSIGSQFANKFAILYVVDSTGTTQYIGQTRISADGKYSYTFKLKEEPTVTSGDYRVLISIEGSTSAIELEPILAPVPEYTVTFRNDDGAVLKTQVVRKGESAIAPEIPTKTGYNFVGWDKTATNIQSDMVITAQFEKRVFDVVFVDEVNSTTETVQYEYGDILNAPEMSELPEAYNFVGWDAILNRNTIVEDNMVVNAVYEKKVFDVTFIGYNDEELCTYSVEYGDGVTPPELTKDDVHVFISWDTDIDFENVTDGGIVRPLYEYVNTVASPVANISDGEYDDSQTVSLLCDTEGAQIYYTIDGTDPLEQTCTTKALSKVLAKSADVNNYAGTLYTGPFTINESSELVFAAVKDDMNNSTYEIKNYAINTSSNNKHLVTVHYGLYNIEYSYLTEEGSIVNPFPDGEYETGYTLTGVYTDKSFTSAWDLEKDTVTGKTDIYLKWEKNTYSVTFIDKDDNVISEQQVDYLDSAEAPLIPEYAGYTFSGWDTDYEDINCNTVVKATYVKSSDLTTIELSASDLKLDTKTPFAVLTANTILADNSTNTHVIWESSDENIATVDEEGKVTAVNNGTATVYAISDESGVSASCNVTVSFECAHNAITTIIGPTCTEDGSVITKCSLCGEIMYTELMPATGHSDTDKDGKCDACGEHLADASNCSCNCHKKGFAGFIYRIIRIFWKLFRINKVCACGQAHY